MGGKKERMKRKKEKCKTVVEEGKLLVFEMSKKQMRRRGRLKEKTPYP